MSAIEWTDKTWNPVTGCSKVSDGCDHCYAETLAMGRLAGKRGYPGLPWTPENAERNVVLRPERLDQPTRLRKPHMIFVNSMSDLFHPRIPGEFIGEVFDVMEACPQHIFQVLTKRPKRMASWAKRYRPEPLPNVWLGTSIENRDWVGRADALRDCPAAIRFISAEPLLGPLIASDKGEYPTDYGTGREGYANWEDGRPVDDDHPELNLVSIDWLIVGGESGDGHRPMDPEWVRALRDACRTHELVCCDPQLKYGTNCCDQPDDHGPRTAFFFKQWGGRTPKSGGRELDGQTWDEYPAQVGAVA